MKDFIIIINNNIVDNFFIVIAFENVSDNELFNIFEIIYINNVDNFFIVNIFMNIDIINYRVTFNNDNVIFNAIFNAIIFININNIEIKNYIKLENFSIFIAIIFIKKIRIKYYF